MYSVCAGVKDVPIDEDIQREKGFLEAVEACIKQIEKIPSMHLPLEIAPGKRVKSKKEMKEIEAPAIESRKPQRVRGPKTPKRKVEVVDRIGSMVTAAKENLKHDKEDRKGKKKEKKKQKPGKSKRMKRR